MVSIILLASLGLACAAPLLNAAQEGAITAHVKKINTDLTALNEKLGGYNGGLIAALPIKTAAETVEASMKTAAADIKKEASPAADPALQEVIDAVKTLNPNVETAMKALSEKAEKFGAAKPIVKQILTRMSDIEKEMGDGLVSRASPALQSVAKDEDQKLRQLFSGAMGKF